VSSRYELGDTILDKLSRTFQISPDDFAALKAALGRDYFKVLVATILSQNTNEKNTFKAIKKLEESIGIKPHLLASVDENYLEEAISPAGLQSTKSKAIKEAAKLIVERYDGDITNLLKKGEKRVREELGKIRGIGDKTIDVLLANYGYPIVAIDTHVRRVARRLGLTHAKTYMAIREDLEKVFRPEKRLTAHLLLILLGRNICKAKRPACLECPLKDICEYYNSLKAKH
jgi:endonuclease-3